MTDGASQPKRDPVADMVAEGSPVPPAGPTLAHDGSEATGPRPETDVRQLPGEGPLQTPDSDSGHREREWRLTRPMGGIDQPPAPPDPRAVPGNR